VLFLSRVNSDDLSGASREMCAVVLYEGDGFRVVYALLWDGASTWELVLLCSVRGVALP